MATKKFINNESNEAVELNECKLTKSLKEILFLSFFAGRPAGRAGKYRFSPGFP